MMASSISMKVIFINSHACKELVSSRRLQKQKYKQSIITALWKSWLLLCLQLLHCALWPAAIRKLSTKPNTKMEPKCILVVSYWTAIPTLSSFVQVWRMITSLGSNTIRNAWKRTSKSSSMSTWKSKASRPTPNTTPVPESGYRSFFRLFLILSFLILCSSH